MRQLLSRLSASDTVQQARRIEHGTASAIAASETRLRRRSRFRGKPEARKRNRSTMTESRVAILRSHVAQAERLVARQKALVEKMALAEVSATGEMARTLLAVLEGSLQVSRKHLRRMVEQYGDDKAAE
jgi:hypothetical protein